MRDKILKDRIMYIERKVGLTGEARIGRVKFSKTGKTMYYRGMELRRLERCGFKSNYSDVKSGDQY